MNYVHRIQLIRTIERKVVYSSLMLFVDQSELLRLELNLPVTGEKPPNKSLPEKS